MSSATPDEAIIVGASLAGLCTAWQLRKRGVQRITVLERHRVGHRRGASHGRSRVLSAAGMADPVQALIMRARSEAWPALQSDLGRRVFKSSTGLVMGPLSDAFQALVKTSFGQPEHIRAIPLAGARSQHPMLTLPTGTGTAVDETALLIAAESAMDALLTWLQRQGVAIVPNTRVLSVHSTADGLWLETDRGRRVAERVVVTAGTGMGALFDRATSRIEKRIEVSGFFPLTTPEATWRSFPVVRALDAEGRPRFTVCPEFADRGVKVTRHSRADDLDADACVAELRQWFQNTLGVPTGEMFAREVRRVVHIEDRPMVIDTHHDDPRIVFAVGSNGHEIALAPILGQSLAELVLDGRSQVAEFQRHRKHFALPRRGLPARRKRPKSQGVKF